LTKNCFLTAQLITTAIKSNRSNPAAFWPPSNVRTLRVVQLLPYAGALFWQ